MKEKIILQPSTEEQKTRSQLLKLYLENPIPEEQILDHVEIFLRPQRIYEMLSLFELYKKILDVPGDILEFGVRWGRHLTLFNSLRAYLEPYNFYRRIIGFDTFEGFKKISDEDGKSSRIFEGAMSVSPNYENFIKDVLLLHEKETPISHIRKCEIKKGNASDQFKKFLNENPETIVALAYFDLDLFKPTKECLELLRECMPKGSIIAFDELTNHQFPGETIAFKEVYDINKIDLKKIPGSPYPTYFVVE